MFFVKLDAPVVLAITATFDGAYSIVTTCIKVNYHAMHSAKCGIEIAGRLSACL